MTVTDLVTVPAAFAAVIVYMVLEKGLALALPEGGTYPPPWSRKIDEAP